jgi:enoyl-CoA hydratase/carnithine racemase
MPVSVERIGDVALVRWADGDNRINPDSMGRLLEVLDELETIEGPLAVVWTGHDKFFSNGLDLERFAEHPEQLGETTPLLYRFFARMLVFPAYTVTAINGHAFAGGAMLTCTTDYRVMRSDRGYWCLNEVELGLPLTDEMAALVLGRLPRRSALEAMLTARRFDAAAALEAGIVDEIAPEDDVLQRAMDRAALIATKDRKVVAIHKRQAFADVARALGARA